MPEILPDPVAGRLKFWSHILSEPANDLLRQGMNLSYVLDLYPDESDFYTLQQRLAWLLSKTRDIPGMWNEYDCFKITAEHDVARRCWNEQAKIFAAMQNSRIITKTEIRGIVWSTLTTAIQNGNVFYLKDYIVSIATWLVAPHAVTDEKAIQDITADAERLLQLLEKSPAMQVGVY